jgi:hypothetical protein
LEYLFCKDNRYLVYTAGVKYDIVLEYYEKWDKRFLSYIKTVKAKEIIPQSLFPSAIAVLLLQQMWLLMRSQAKPTIAAISTPAALCSGGSLNSTAQHTVNGSTISSQAGQMSTTSGGSTYAALTVLIPLPLQTMEKMLLYSYQRLLLPLVNVAVLTVNDKPTIAAISAPMLHCGGGSLTTPTVTFNSSTI